MSISIQNVSRDFRSLWALREINAEIAAGSTVAVLGANGAGKSTLLRLIAGWIPPAEGRIQIQGHTMRINSMSVRRRLMLLDEPRSGEASIIEMIGQAISDYQVDRPELANEVAEWFEKLDLVGNYGKSANAVSKGQRYKVAMICLFLVRPNVWLLDEPFSAGLDAGGLQVLESEMAAHAAAGGTVVFSSQWPDHANRLADRSLVLHEGKVVCDQPIGQSVDDDLIASAPTSLQAVLAGLCGQHQ